MISTAFPPALPFDAPTKTQGQPVADWLYTALLDHFSGVFALTDIDLRVLAAGGTELPHDRTAFLPGQYTLQDLLPRELIGVLEPYIHIAQKGTRTEYTAQLSHSAYSVSIVPIASGSEQALLITASRVQQPLEQPQQQPGKQLNIEDQLYLDGEAFQLAMRATSDGIWDWNLQNNTLTFSARCAEMLGYSADEERPSSYETWAPYVYSEDLQLFVHMVQEHCQKGTPLCGIVRMHHRDGTLRWILKRGFSLRDEHGVPWRIVGSCTDMTELRLREEQQLSSERWFSSLLQHSSDLTAILNEDGNIIYQNAAFTHTFGSDASKPFAELLHPESRESFSAHLSALKSTRAHPLSFEGHYQCTDGRDIWLDSVFTSLLHDPSVQGIIVNSRDISERRRAERLTADFNALLIGIMESSSTSIYSLDRELRYTAFSSTHQKHVKERLNVDIERGHRITDYMPTNTTGSAVIAKFQQALAGERSSITIEYGDPDNTTYNEILINPIRDTEGDVTGLAVFVNDITERQRAQQQLSRAYDELELRVRERTADLQQTLEKLNNTLSREKELGELKTRFVSMVSHEFRTPLTSILSSVEILERYREKLSKEQQTRFYYMITESVHRMSDLLNNVILLSRAESNNIYFNPIHLQPDTYCRKLIEELSIGVLKERVVQYTTEGTMREVLVDPQLLHYILANLLSNAVKYSPEQEPVYLSVILSDTSITFRVADQGIGIAPEDLKHIYDPFFRSEHVETIPGTGLGLSIVKQSVARHGGTIEVEANTNGGTTFTVRLPA